MTTHTLPGIGIITITKDVQAADVKVGDVLAGSPFEGEIVTQVSSYDERTLIHTEGWVYETMGEEMISVYAA